LTVARSAWPAACCGGGFAAPALISGDDRAQLTASYGYSEIADDVGADSLWRRREGQELSQTFKLEAAHIFRDRWQAGAGIPLVKRSRAGESSTGLGDIAATLGYEYLPDWDYSPWRPKGLGFIQLTAPSGRSINESDAMYQLDARGRGFWAIGAGTLLTKIIGKWDLFSSLEAHRSFARHFANASAQGTLRPGFGGSLGFGAGYNLTALRFGGGITWTYEDPVDVSGTLNSLGSPQRYATASLSASYLMRDDLAVTYTDQTWFGSPANTTLGRGALLLLQKRWPR
jgi:hypothetical protein